MSRASWRLAGRMLFLQRQPRNSYPPRSKKQEARTLSKQQYGSLSCDEFVSQTGTTVQWPSMLCQKLQNPASLMNGFIIVAYGLVSICSPLQSISAPLHRLSTHCPEDICSLLVSFHQAIITYGRTIHS